MIFGNRDRRQMPQLNTASLPDLIFTVLFFFMVVTHMRTVTLKVSFRVPQGTELTRLTKKTAVSYIYIGRPTAAPGLGKPASARSQAASEGGNNGFQMQINARMSAMNSAGSSADKLLGELTKEYNAQRQAAITREITEITAGARALKRQKEKK